jgi:hypothetical protein
MTTSFKQTLDGAAPIRSSGLMRKSIFTALRMGFGAFGGCARVRYPGYYALNLPNPVSASRDAAPISGSVAAIVRELQHVFEPAALYEGRGAAEFLLSGSLDHLETENG